MCTQMDERPDTQQGKYLTFLVDSTTYGMDISYITEIVGIQKITTLPESKEYFKGIINLRGRITPVIDMRTRLSKPETAYHDRTCIIVVESHDINAGLIVDGVAEVETFESDSIVPPPTGVGGGQSQILQGIAKAGDNIVLLVDLSLLLENSPELLKLISE